MKRGADPLKQNAEYICPFELVLSTGLVADGHIIIASSLHTSP
jgi:hypothetical protein